MKVKEILSPDFKNDDILKENEKYIAKEIYHTGDKVKVFVLQDKESEEIIFNFNVPHPLYCREPYEQDICLRYGHGARGFILALFDKISEDKEIVPPYTPDYSSDVIFHVKPRGVYIFAKDEPTYQVGFIKETEYMNWFIDYFGFRTASVFA